MNFNAARWSRRIEKLLGAIPGAGEFMDDWRQGVLSGRLSLWSVAVGGADCGALIWEVEREGSGHGLTVLALACEGAGRADVASEVVRVFDGLGRLCGASWLRFWTRRPGLRRIMQRAGFRTREISEADGLAWMMERSLAHGQQ